MTKKFIHHLGFSLLAVVLAMGCGDSHSPSEDPSPDGGFRDPAVRDPDAALPPTEAPDRDAGPTETDPDAGAMPDPERVITPEVWQDTVRSFCEALDTCGPVPVEPGEEESDGDFDEFCDPVTGAGNVDGEIWRTVFESQECAAANTVLLECGTATLTESCFDEEDEESCVAEEEALVESCSWGALGAE